MGTRWSVRRQPVSVCTKLEINKKLVEVEASVDKWYDAEPDAGEDQAYFVDFDLYNLDESRYLTDAEWQSISKNELLRIRELLYEEVY